MKNKLLLSIFSFAAVALVLTGCQNEDQHYIKISSATCSFTAEDDDAKVIKVDASSAWEAKSSIGWLKVVDVTANSFALTAEHNDTGMERIARIAVTANGISKEIVVNQLMKDSGISRYRRLEQFTTGTVISPSGKYIAGYITDVSEYDDSFEYMPVIIDVETDKWHQFGPYPQSLFDFAMPLTVSDEGLFFIGDDSQGTFFIDLDGTYGMLDNPSGFSSSPTVQGTSADGTIWVGYAHRGLYRPLKYTNKVVEELPLPELNYRGDAFSSGVMARGISANGEIIYGTTWDDLDAGMVYWDKQGDVHYVGEDVRELTPITIGTGADAFIYNLVKGIKSWSGSTHVSPNGKYIAGTYAVESLGDNGSDIEVKYYAAFFNTETEKTVIFEEFEDSVGLNVTNEGIGFIGDKQTATELGYVVDVENGTLLGKSEEWIRAKFGINVPKGYIICLTAGEEVVLGASLVSISGTTRAQHWYVATAIN